MLEIYRYKIEIEYVGEKYHGSYEVEGLKTIQGTIQNAILNFCAQKTIIYMAGRTDKGVHAICQTAHFDLSSFYDPQTLLRAVNFYLKNEDIKILKCEQVDLNFHARFSCKYRKYMYVICNRISPPVLEKGKCLWLSGNINLEEAQECLKLLIGTHDFSTFCPKKYTGRRIRTLEEAHLQRSGDYIYFFFKARSFIHNQIRNMIGLLLEVATGKISKDNFLEKFQCKNRSCGFQKVSPQGLFFLKAYY